MPRHIEVLSVNIGLPTLLGELRGKEVFSSINKRSVRGMHQLELTDNGLTGDGPSRYPCG